MGRRFHSGDNDDIHCRSRGHLNCALARDCTRSRADSSRSVPIVRLADEERWPFCLRVSIICPAFERLIDVLLPEVMGWIVAVRCYKRLRIAGATSGGQGATGYLTVKDGGKLNAAWLHTREIFFNNTWSAFQRECQWFWVTTQCHGHLRKKRPDISDCLEFRRRRLRP